MSEYRIDELARIADTTSRNVRAYQERGLLPPPVKRGRIGIYTDTHLARLRLITSLHDRGYTSTQITELISSWEQGRNLADVLGLEEALNSPWTDEIPTYLPTDQVRAFLAGSEVEEPALFERIVRLGLLKPDGDQCLVPSPQLITTVAELLSKGFRLADLLTLHEAIAPAIDDIARRMVEAGAARLVEEHGEAWLPEGSEVGEATELLQRLRQLATSSVHSLLAHALERHVTDVMGEHLARVIKQNHPDLG
ncbi:MAG: MerR family transcriptional regulator [Pseudonocardia sp.]|nr:MerR family transcriptional regulator [Pseudonocardia sp.]MBO0873454.1 MerR family transcriptional regulator [Pseudonocardia sp.]